MTVEPRRFCKGAGSSGSTNFTSRDREQFDQSRIVCMQPSRPPDNSQSAADSIGVVSDGDGDSRSAYLDLVDLNGDAATSDSAQLDSKISKIGDGATGELAQVLQADPVRPVGQQQFPYGRCVWVRRKSGFAGQFVVGVAIDKSDPVVLIRNEIDPESSVTADFVDDLPMVYDSSLRGSTCQFPRSTAEREAGQILDPNQISVGDQKVQQTVCGCRCNASEVGDVLGACSRADLRYGFQ